MKKLFLISLLTLPVVNAMAQDDDLYFAPDMTGVIENVQENSPSVNVRTPRRTETAVYDKSKLSVYNNSSRDEDEYNRRYNFSSDYQTEGGADYSLDYESNDTIFNTDTIYDDTDDYAYSRRILRFHSPRVAVALSSPYYWDLVYGYGVYDYLYDAYYDPFFYSWGWGYGWSWGPWSCWYGGLWGWHHPYRWSYWGWGPGWHHGHYGRYYGWNHGRYSDRGGMGGFRNRYDKGHSIRTSHLANGGNASLSRGTFGGRSNSIASRGNTTRSLRGGDRVGLRSNPRAGRTDGGRGVASRSSYADYSRSRSVNTPDSRVYNRTTAQNRTSYDRPSSSRSTYTPSRSSSTYNSRSTYTPSRSTSTYNSRSTYTPSRSSSTSRSYTPSRSSSSGSFGGGRSSFGGGGRSGGFGGGGGRGGGFGGGRGGGGRR